MPDTVTDNPRLHRYELEGGGHTAFVSYSRAPGTITFIHAEVPSALAGRGIGSALARGALEAARAAGEKVIAKCSFIAAFIAKHKEFQDLLSRSS